MCNIGSNTFSCYSDKYVAEEAKPAMLRYDANSKSAERFICDWKCFCPLTLRGDVVIGSVVPLMEEKQKRDEFCITMTWFIRLSHDSQALHRSTCDLNIHLHDPIWSGSVLQSLR